MPGSETAADSETPTPAPAETVAAATHPGADSGTLFAGKKLFWIPVLPLLWLDLWSKSAAFAALREQAGGYFNQTASIQVFAFRPVEFELVNYLNLGTIWGIFGEWHEGLKYLRLVAIGVILYFVLKTPRHLRLMLLALSLILAGALGNLYDNFIHAFPAGVNPALAGAVRDFIHFHNPGSWDFPAFNVADSCITVGAFALFIMLWRHGPFDAKPGAPLRD